MKNSRYDQDFQDFASKNDAMPPGICDHAIIAQIERDLHPPVWSTFGKLLAVQSVIGVLTMLFCPQFHLSLTANDQLFHFFHRIFGEVICMALCGAVFVGTGGIVAAGLLSQADIKRIRETAALHYFAVSSVFLTSFLLLGAEFYLELVSAWILGASFFGALCFELSSKIVLRVRTT